MANYKKLQNVLTELFQLDKAELDFGIYRIMNQKRDDVLDFLSNKLPKEVRAILEGQQKGDATQLKKDLDNAIKTAKEFGVDPETNPKVLEAKAAYEAAGSIEGLEQEVFSHLASFFKRYYDGGDFVSLRRYKKDVYAIPYEGEEVKLHWANHDQYYIKTSENLKNYAFKVDGDKTVKFTLKEANTEQNNNKNQKDQERRFALFTEEPVTIDGETIHINFTYELHKKSIKQDKLIDSAVEQLTDKVPADFAKLFSLAPTEKNKKRTLLEKHLVDFSARNTFDYFIHKDLGCFLTRELDFYIKNEVLFIDDINTDNELAFATQLSKIRALKQVASKIITFLAQLENFQKKLWLKKKFVVSCDYCITLDKIPDNYYSEIIENTAQLEEWKTLFNVEIKTLEELKEESYLVLDTKFFSQEFKDKLLAEYDDLDDQTNGVLINSDNEQALRILYLKHKENIQQIYIDPPYNTGNDDGFAYKDNFQRSSWLSMMTQRLLISKLLLKKNGTFSMSIDIKELHSSIGLLDDIYGEENKRNNIAIRRSAISGPKVINPGVVNITENLVLYSNNLKNWKENKVFRERERDSRYGTFIINFEDPFEKWNYSSVLEAFSEFKGIKKSQLKKELGVNYKSQLDNFVIDNAEKVIQFANLDEKSVSKAAIDIKRKSLENPLLTFKLERNDKDDYIVHKGKVALFYSSRLIKIGEKYVPGEPLSDIWDDVLPNDLHNEGGVKLRKGKKPEKLVERVLSIGSSKGETVLDFFVGSGTTAAVALKTGKKFIGVEQGEYFKLLTLRRIKNSLNGESSGVSKLNKWKGGGVVKYFNLESYEDALNNLQLKPNQVQQQVLDTNADLQEEYLLQYMLDVETREHLMNIEAFKNPFNYKLNITENNELAPTTIDLVETFNYLIGLHVKRVQRIGAFKTVEGSTNDGDKVLVIWRNLDESNNDDLNTFVSKMDYNLRDGEFDTIYVNGDNNLANLRQDTDTWKVGLLEEVFFTLMFDNKDI